MRRLLFIVLIGLGPAAATRAHSGDPVTVQRAPRPQRAFEYATGLAGPMSEEKRRFDADLQAPRSPAQRLRYDRLQTGERAAAGLEHG